jgi:hypothetical protein
MPRSEKHHPIPRTPLHFAILPFDDRQPAWKAVIRVTLILACALTKAPARGDERTVSYPDGSPKQVFSVDDKDVRHGTFTELFPNGKTKTSAVYVKGVLQGPVRRYHENGRLQFQSTYVKGKLHGPATDRDDKGRILKQTSFREGVRHGPCRHFENGVLERDEYWVDDRLLVPRTPAIIRQYLEKIRKAPVETVGDLPDMPPPVVKAVGSPQEQRRREDATRVLMAYRYLCGVPHRDIKLDRGYIAHNVVTCELLNQVGKLTHNPENPGWPEEQYKIGLKGASCSNLYTAWSRGSSEPPSMVAAFRSWMDDSDEGNIQRLGHRRWCLNPSLIKFGIASSGAYCSMWAFDESRPQPVDFDFIAFPPRGVLPAQAFEGGYAWHLSVNPKKYKPPRKDAVKVRIVPATVDFRKGVVARTPQALQLDYFNVDLAGFGIPNAIIFRPKDFQVTAGRYYWVEVQGVVDNNDQPAPLEYLVGFFQ